MNRAWAWGLGRVCLYSLDMRVLKGLGFQVFVFRLPLGSLVARFLGLAEGNRGLAEGNRGDTNLSWPLRPASVEPSAGATIGTIIYCKGGNFGVRPPNCQ